MLMSARLSPGFYDKFMAQKQATECFVSAAPIHLACQLAAPEFINAVV